jgi:hypothetical protein
LFVLSALEDEYLTSSRLKNKFEWVNDKAYKQDRLAKKYKCRGQWASEVENAFSFLAAYAKENSLLLAPEDLKALAVGFVRNFTVVSDDRALCKVADAHGIAYWGTLDLLKSMVDCGRIPGAKICEILEYLDQENDLPMGKARLRERYGLLFDGNCPI